MAELLVHATELLTEQLQSVSKPTTKNCIGITSFIKLELVADGQKKPAVKLPQNAVFAANAAASGLRIGRKFDAAFQNAVNHRQHSHETLSAFACLKTFVSILPIACQHRVTSRSSNITTLLDAVGIDIRTHRPVCIELKTCQLSVKVYDEYATSVCRRTPFLRCTPQLPNSERTRHFLQAAFGAECLRQQLGVDVVNAVVLVKCKDGFRVYRVPQMFHSPAYFVRLPATNILASNKPPTTGGRKAAAKTQAQIKTWPAICGNAVTQSLGFTVAHSPGPGSKRFKPLARNGTCAGIAVHCPAWSKLSAAKRERVKQEIANFAASAKKSGRITTFAQRLTPLVLTVLTPNGRNQLILAGAPFRV
jgi:hypothetical protein